MTGEAAGEKDSTWRQSSCFKHDDDDDHRKSRVEKLHDLQLHLGHAN